MRFPGRALSRAASAFRRLAKLPGPGLSLARKRKWKRAGETRPGDRLIEKFLMAGRGRTVWRMAARSGDARFRADFRCGSFGISALEVEEVG